jgi:AMP-binding enzyme C-terminal domain
MVWLAAIRSLRQGLARGAARLLPDGKTYQQIRIALPGRSSNFITSAPVCAINGPRQSHSGPGEIKDCLIRHEAVQAAAVLGKPDAARTEIVKAYVVLREGVAISEELKQALQNFVKMRLAAHEYPREIAFVSALPMTTTGKIIRRELREQARMEAIVGRNSG